MSRRRDVAGWGAFVVVLLVAPWLVYPVFAMKVLCFALFASAFNLLIGRVGLLSLGHAAFFGVGSYVAAYLAKLAGASAEMALAAAAGAGALLGGAVGVLAIRRQGIYFSMITLALAQLVYFVCVEIPQTGGEDGIQLVPRAPLLGLVPLGSDLAMYALVAALFLGGLLLIRRIMDSPFGQVLTAVRDNETRAVSLGYRVERYKLLAFVLSAALAGLAGGAKALVFGIATLSDVHWTMSGEVVLMTLVGGMGTLAGPVVGALVVVTMETYLAPLGAWVTVAQGAVFVLCVLAFRRGVVGSLAGMAGQTT